MATLPLFLQTIPPSFLCYLVGWKEEWKMWLPIGSVLLFKVPLRYRHLCSSGKIPSHSSNCLARFETATYLVAGSRSYHLAAPNPRFKYATLLLSLAKPPNWLSPQPIFVTTFPFPTDRLTLSTTTLIQPPLYSEFSHQSVLCTSPCRGGSCPPWTWCCPGPIQRGSSCWGPHPSSPRDSHHTCIYRRRLRCTENPKLNYTASFPIPTFMYLWAI